MHTPLIDIVFEYQQLYNFEYRIAQKLTVENFDESDKWLAISQNISLLTFSSYEAYNQFIKVLLFKSFMRTPFVKVLCYNYGIQILPK